MTLEKDKKVHDTEVGEFWFDEKNQSLHIKSRTGFNSYKWRNLDEAIEENLKEHFENDQNK